MAIKTPLLAVDIICFHPMSMTIAVIERKNPPRGLALPGGFVDIGESCASAARREAKEELNVDLLTLQFLGVYDAPDRDPRGHVVSMAYVAVINQIPVAGDDAKSYLMWNPSRLLTTRELCFDHAQIIKDALKLGMIPTTEP